MISQVIYRRNREEAYCYNKLFSRKDIGKEIENETERERERDKKGNLRR